MLERSPGTGKLLKIIIHYRKTGNLWPQVSKHPWVYYSDTQGGAGTSWYIIVMFRWNGYQRVYSSYTIEVCTSSFFDHYRTVFQ